MSFYYVYTAADRLIGSTLSLREAKDLARTDNGTRIDEDEGGELLRSWQWHDLGEWEIEYGDDIS